MSGNTRSSAASCSFSYFPFFYFVVCVKRFVLLCVELATSSSFSTQHTEAPNETENRKLSDPFS